MGESRRRAATSKSSRLTGQGRVRRRPALRLGPRFTRELYSASRRGQSFAGLRGRSSSFCGPPPRDFLLTAVRLFAQTEPPKFHMPVASQAGRKGQFHAVTAGFLGWTLDAFDFFVVVFLFDTLAHQFGVPKKSIVLTVTATLAMRPLGALLFGLLSDRYGRRVPLMLNVLYFSVIEVMC